MDKEEIMKRLGGNVTEEELMKLFSSKPKKQKKRQTHKGERAEDYMGQREPDRTFTEDEIREFCTAARSDRRDMWTCIITMSGTGMRPFETLSLKPFMLGFPRAQFTEIRGKQGKKREIPFHDRLWAELHAYIKEEKLERDQILFDFNIRTLQRHVKKYADEVGIKWIATPYSCRDYFATRFSAMRGEGLRPVVILKAIMGHNLFPNERYVKITPEEKIEAVNAVFKDLIL